MYQSRSGGARQVLGTGLVVGALQLGIAAALLSTFAGGAIGTVIHRTLQDHWIDIPPPPPKPTQTAHAAMPNHDTIAAPDPAVPGLSTPTSITLGPLVPMPPVGGDDRQILSDFTPPKPTLTQPSVAAHPLGDTAQWITPGDYPSRALREGWSGVTRLHLLIGSDGHVNGCTVIASSGHDALDAVACEKVSQRARFSPARDGSGATRDGTFDSAIHWQINEE